MSYSRITLLSSATHGYSNFGEYVRAMYGEGVLERKHNPTKLERNLCKGMGKPLAHCSYKEIKLYVTEKYTYTWWNRVRVFLHKSHRFLVLRDIDLEDVMEYQAYHTKRVDLASQVEVIVKSIKKDPKVLDPYVAKLRDDPALFDYLMTGDVAHSAVNKYEDNDGIVSISELPAILKARKCVRGNKKLLKVISHLKELIRRNISIDDLSVTVMDLIVDWHTKHRHASKRNHFDSLHSVNATKPPGARAKRREKVKELLADGETISEIERLTGMTRKYIRKYK